MVANYNAVVQTDGYGNMVPELKDGLTRELADENVFVGLKRQRTE